jgi:hypothetical protein
LAEEEGEEGEASSIGSLRLTLQLADRDESRFSVPMVPSAPIIVYDKKAS